MQKPTGKTIGNKNALNLSNVHKYRQKMFKSEFISVSLSRANKTCYR